MKNFTFCFILISSFAFAERVHFHKELDVKRLESLAVMDSDKLIQEIQKEVILYRFKREGEDHVSVLDGINKISELPAPMYKQFRQDIIFGATGIYLSPYDLRFNVSKPTLILREDTTRWVLLHEFTHYLFDKARVEMNEQESSAVLSKLQDTLDGLNENIQKFHKHNNQFADHQHEQETADCIVVGTDLRLRSMNSYELEEIAIETILKKIYESKIQSRLEVDDYKNATGYIQENINSVRRSLGFLQDSIQQLDSAWSNPQTKSILQGLNAKMDLLLAEVANF